MNLAAAPPSIQECGLWKKTSPASELEKGWDQGGVRLGFQAIMEPISSTHRPSKPLFMREWTIEKGLIVYISSLSLTNGAPLKEGPYIT